jgi:hypothetical protein
MNEEGLKANNKCTGEGHQQFTPPTDLFPLTEMSIRSREIMFLGSRERPVCKAEKLKAICKPIV